MPEPTIDADEWERERLAYERKVDVQKELEAIRAFVERVEKRYQRVNEDFPMAYTDYDLCMEQELAAMEQETKEKSE